MNLNKTKPAILLSFDIEEFDVPEEHGITMDFDTQIKVSRLGVERILDTLKKYPEVRATFYVTAQFAQACPDLVERMVRCGEIASHGFYHSRFSVEDLVASRKVLSNLSKQEVIGFRMPRMAKVSEQELYDAGYRYDSSSNPTFIPGRYNALSQPAIPFFKPSGLLEIPASVTPGLRIPLFWLAFKNFPRFMFKLLACHTLKNRGFLNIYWHPWEFNEAIKSSEFKLPKFVVRCAGDTLTRRLDYFISQMQGRGVFMTTSEFAQRFFATREERT